MYDARERFLRDRKWEQDAMFRDGKIEGEIEALVRTLQGLAGVPVAEEQELRAFTLEQLQAMTSDLRGESVQPLTQAARPRPRFSAAVKYL